MISRLLAATVLFALTVPGLWLLRSDFSHRGFFFGDDPRLVTYDAFVRDFGSDDTVVIGVERVNGELDADSWQHVRALAGAIDALPQVVGLDVATNLASPEALATRKPPACVGTLVDAEWRLALIVGHLRRDVDANTLDDDVAAVIATHEDANYRIHVTGTPAITAAFETVASHDMERLVPIAVVTMAIVLSLFMRSLTAAVLTMFSVGVGVLSAMAAAGLAGIAINNMTLAIPQILLAIGTAGSVHLIGAYRKARLAGSPSRVAMQNALERNRPPMLLAAASTVVGFLSLTSSDLKAIASLGVIAGVGTILVTAYTFLLLAPLVEWLAPYRIVEETSSRPTRSIAASYVDGLIHYWPLIASAALIAVVVGIEQLSELRIDSDPLRYFAEDVPVRQATELIQERVGGVRGIEILVRGNDHAIEVFRDELRANPNVTATLGPETIRALPLGRDAPRWRSDDGRQRISLLWSLRSSRDVMATVRALKKRMSKLDLDGTITGKTLLYQCMNDDIVRSFARSALLALVVIATILTLALRSLRLGLLSLIPNVIPLLAGAICVRLSGRTLDIGATLVASVCFGIAVDDTIHIIAGYRIARQRGATPVAAMTETLEHRARAVIVTTVVLVSTFGTFVLGDFVPNALFGVLCACVLGVALIADLTVLPLLLIGADRIADRTRHVGALTASVG